MRAGKFLWNALLIPQRVVLVVLSLYTTGLIVASVIFRYFLHASFLWVEELTVYVVFWFYLMGAALCTYERTHIKGGVVHLVLRDRPRILRGSRTATTLLSFGLCVLFTFWGYEAFAYTLGGERATIHTRLPQAYAQLSLIPGFAFMSLYFLAELIDSIRGKFYGSA